MVDIPLGINGLILLQNYDSSNFTICTQGRGGGDGAASILG